MMLWVCRRVPLSLQDTCECIQKISVMISAVYTLGFREKNKHRLRKKSGKITIYGNKMGVSNQVFSTF